MFTMLERFLKKKKPAGPDVGDAAPDFSLPSLDGGSFTLSEQLKQGPLVLAFFKITCSTCQFTFPFLERMYRSHQNDPVAFWGVSQDDAEKSQMFRERFGVTFSVALDHESYSASRLYHFSSVPTILLVDREGTVRFRQSGFSKAGLTELSEEIGHLLTRPPETVFLVNERVPELKPG
jgi:peroxiredoxin